MNIEIVFLSDSHLGFDYPVRPKLDIRRRGVDFFLNFNRTLEYALKIKADLVIHGGDLFFRSKVPGMIIDKTYHILLSFAQSGIPLYIIPGNHERSQLPQSLLLQHPKIHIFSQPKTFLQTIGNINISLSGFPCERKYIREKFKTLIKNCGWASVNPEIKLLCLHQVIENAQVGPTNYIFTTGDDVIPLSFLPDDATAVLVGHIHRQQELLKRRQDRTDSVPVLFSGSIERTSFAEKNELKGFYHLSFRKSDNEQWALSQKKFVNLATRPMVDIEVPGGMEMKEIELFILNYIENQPDAIIRIRYTSNPNPRLRTELNSQWLRKILPETVNFVIRRDA